MSMKICVPIFVLVVIGVIGYSSTMPSVTIGKGVAKGEVKGVIESLPRQFIKEKDVHIKLVSESEMRVSVLAPVPFYLNWAPHDGVEFRVLKRSGSWQAEVVHGWVAH